MGLEEFRKYRPGLTRNDRVHQIHRRTDMSPISVAVGSEL